MCHFYFMDTGRREQGMSKLYFNNAKQAQQAYDNFAERHIKEIHENQTEIDRLLDRSNQTVDKSGKHIEEVLKQAKDNEVELLKSVTGYISQAKKAQCDFQYRNEDYNRLKRNLLPTDRTYCCVMKEPLLLLSRKKDIEGQGLKEKDLSLLFRLIPCVGFNTGILLNPDNNIPFISIADIAEYLEENSRSDGALGRSMQRLIKNEIIWRYGDLFVVNDYWIRCGAMTTGVLTSRHRIMKKYRNRQGEKATNKQGKNKEQKTVEIDKQKEPQTQATSEEEEEEKIPF